MQDFALFALRKPQPILGEARYRANAAADWLLRAQDASEDGGASYGYFPCDCETGWLPSYPETTGYIIPTLLEVAEREQRPDIQERTLRMARWEITIQMESGAVQGGIVCSSELQTPAVFNTGMVLQGWTAAYRLCAEKTFLVAGKRAADFLVANLTPEGYFRTTSTFVTRTGIKTYKCLCAWALYRFGQDMGDETYLRAAIRVIEAALLQQRPNGWFANNCLSRPDAPLSHTIGYTLQGILEVGILSKRPEFIDAVVRGLKPLLAQVSTNGFVPGRFYEDWSPGNRSSCLTGAAQIAVVLYRLHEYNGDIEHKIAADRIVNFLKILQRLDTRLPGVNGALAGSFPLFGEYQTAGYPNWATKYFLDALMSQDRATHRSPSLF